MRPKAQVRNEGPAALSGILNVNKPAQMTSHDVVDVVRRLSGQRRVGHAGTLDPMATGVLVICMGWATRLSEYLMEGTKRYRATLCLGATTDTYDAEGTVVTEAAYADVTRLQFDAVLLEHLGEIEQIPPMYSAIKRQGVPLYRLARGGESVSREARRVYIEELTVTEWSPPIVTVEVSCSKGTYIRSLVYDVGQKLGCGAHLTALVRVASGPFRLEETVSLTELAEAFAQGRAHTLSYPLTRVLEGFDLFTVDGEMTKRIHHGQAIEGLPAGQKTGLALAMLPSGEPLAVLEYHDDTGLWQPTKVFQ